MILSCRLLDGYIMEQTAYLCYASEMESSRDYSLIYPVSDNYTMHVPLKLEIYDAHFRLGVTQGRFFFAKIVRYKFR